MQSASRNADVNRVFTLVPRRKSTMEPIAVEDRQRHSFGVTTLQGCLTREQ
jgi:hypothetical protein